MTSDIVQNKHTHKRQNKLSNNNAPIISLDILNFFKKEQQSPVTSTPVAKPKNSTELLKVAYKMLSQAEKKIEEKNKIIASLEKIITIDELTGLTNRRGFYEAFKREVDLTNRGYNKGGLLIMIDLDYFKQINDNFGHQAGDDALRKVGDFLKSTVRNMDVAARIGGDEFIILFPNTDISKSMKRAHRLEKDLNELSIKANNKSINIKASIGLKEYKQGDSIESIIADADSKMYESKAKRQRA